MDDKEIVALCFARSEEALVQTKKKYRNYCYTVAYNLLGDESDVEECVNDAFFAVWNQIPPQKPRYFSAFLAKIVRNHALKKLETKSVEKRGGGKSREIFEELEGIFSGSDEEQETVDRMALQRALNAFLESQSPEKRSVFLKRYWYMMPVSDLARDVGVSEGKVRMILYRQRAQLRTCLQKEGILL